MDGEFCAFYEMENDYYDPCSDHNKWYQSRSILGRASATMEYVGEGYVFCEVVEYSNSFEEFDSKGEMEYPIEECNSKNEFVPGDYDAVGEMVYCVEAYNPEDEWREKLESACRKAVLEICDELKSIIQRVMPKDKERTTSVTEENPMPEEQKVSDKAIETKIEISDEDDANKIQLLDEQDDATNELLKGKHNLLQPESKEVDIEASFSKERVVVYLAQEVFDKMTTTKIELLVEEYSRRWLADEYPSFLLLNLQPKTSKFWIKYVVGYLEYGDQSEFLKKKSVGSLENEGECLSFLAKANLRMSLKTHSKIPRPPPQPWPPPHGQVSYHQVVPQFYRAYDNQMMYAFPHGELKPLTKTCTYFLSEPENLKLEHLPLEYNGLALTLVNSLSSLATLGNHTEFEKVVLWLSENLTFDVGARINLFECNIRVLGGLVSAHILATDSTSSIFVMANTMLIDRELDKTNGVESHYDFDFFVIETDFFNDSEKLAGRIAKLSGVAAVKVCATTKFELKKHKLRIKDAKTITFAAIEEGIVVGKGAALVHFPACVLAIKDKLEDADQRLGANIIDKALVTLPYLIAQNACIKMMCKREELKSLFQEFRWKNKEGLSEEQNLLQHTCKDADLETDFSMDKTAIVEEQKVFDQMPEIGIDLLTEEEGKGCLCRDVEVKLIVDETSKDENYDLDDNSENYLNFEDERCRICVDIAVGRGVLDCCKHLFYCAYIDSWATIIDISKELESQPAMTRPPPEPPPPPPPWHLEKIVRPKRTTLQFPVNMVRPAAPENLSLQVNKKKRINTVAFS